MKDIKAYLMNESSSKYFELNMHEREALAEFIGVLSGNIGDKDDNSAYEEVYKTLNDEEKEQLDALYDFLEDTRTYKKANNSTMKGDITLLRSIYEIMANNNAFGDNWDLIDAFEKIIS